MGEPINPHDHEAWNKVDDYLSGKLGDEMFNDMTIVWHSAQYQDTEQELQVNAIVPLRVPYSVFRKPEAELAKLREENQTLRTGAVEQARIIERLEQTLTARENLLDEKDAQIEKMAGEIENLDGACAQREQAMAVLEKERDDYKADFETAERLIKSLTKERDDCKAALEMCRDRAGSYQRENQRLRNDLELQIAENDGLRQAPEVLKRELNGLIQDIAAQRDSAARDRDEAIRERDEALSKLNDIQLILHNDGKGY